MSIMIEVKLNKEVASKELVLDLATYAQEVLDSKRRDAVDFEIQRIIYSSKVDDVDARLYANQNFDNLFGDYPFKKDLVLDQLDDFISNLYDEIEYANEEEGEEEGANDEGEKRQNDDDTYSIEYRHGDAGNQDLPPKNN